MSRSLQPASLSLHEASPQPPHHGALCVVQYDERPIVGALKTLSDANAAYCAAVPASLGGCRYLLSTEPATREVHWMKIVAVQAALGRGDCGTALWLDTDAVVTSADALLALRDEAAAGTANERTSMFITADVVHKPQPGLFNAGVWAARNSSHGIALLDAWSRLYRHDLWRREPASGAWSCSTPPGSARTASQKASDADACGYLGLAWEQSAFAFWLLSSDPAADIGQPWSLPDAWVTPTNVSRLQRHIYTSSVDPTPVVVGSPERVLCTTPAAAREAGKHVCHFFGDFTNESVWGHGFRHLADAYADAIDVEEAAASDGRRHAAWWRA